MKIKILFVLLSLSYANSAAMEEYALPHKPTEEKNWHWFITYLNFSIKTKKITYTLSSFDPAVRIFDKDTDELIMSMQRLTNEGKNTEYPDKDVKITGYETKSKTMLLVIADAKKAIFSIETGGEENKIFSYDAQNKVDLSMRVKECVKMSGGLIRISPSHWYNGTDYTDFFKSLPQQKK